MGSGVGTYETKLPLYLVSNSTSTSNIILAFSSHLCFRVL